MITNKLVGITNTDLLTVPTGKNYAVNTAFFCNTSGTTAENITLYAVASGDTPGDKNTIMKSVPLAVKNTFSIDAEKLLLSAGDKIVAIGTVGNIVAATLSYIEI